MPVRTITIYKKQTVVTQEFSMILETKNQREGKKENILKPVRTNKNKFCRSIISLIQNLRKAALAVQNNTMFLQ